MLSSSSLGVGWICGVLRSCWGRSTGIAVVQSKREERMDRQINPWESMFEDYFVRVGRLRRRFPGADNDMPQAMSDVNSLSLYLLARVGRDTACKLERFEA